MKLYFNKILYILFFICLSYSAHSSNHSEKQDQQAFTKKRSFLESDPIKSDSKKSKKFKLDITDSQEIQDDDDFRISSYELTKNENNELKERLKKLDAAGDFAIPTTDSGFKHLLSVEPGNEKTIISFLNTFVPAFYHDPVVSVSPAPTSLPVLPYACLKQTFMDAHVVSQSGTHYVIEMQAKRHVYFDERALFYACSTYSRQIQEEGFKDPIWYKSFKPVIGIQVLDYDTNRAKGIKDKDIKDTLIERVKQNPLPDEEFLKHYLMTCEKSFQKLDHLQLIQIELGRVSKELYPPKSDFSDLDWWLSTFKFAGKYTEDYIKSLNEDGIVMPEAIKLGFDRLRYSKWNPREIREYKTDIIDREDNIILLAIERSEGMEEGIEKGREEGIKQGIEQGIKQGIEQGIKQGIEQGIEKNRAESRKENQNNALKMLSKGMSIEDVSEFTGFLAEEIQFLVQSQKLSSDEFENNIFNKI